MVRKGKEAAAQIEEHPGGAHITVTAQQSRYALDAIDAPASKEVRTTPSRSSLMPDFQTRQNISAQSMDTDRSPDPN